MKPPGVILALAAAMMCFGKGWAEDPRPVAIDHSVLLQMSAVAQQSKMDAVTLLQDTRLEIYIDSMVARLWANLHTDKPMARVFVVVDAAADAFTYPDGAIYMTTGMLAHTRDEGQLAAILAHELIHYIRDHALAVLNTDGSHQFGHRPHRLSMAPQAAEAQADREGLMLMHASGFCPCAALSLMAHFRDARTSTPMGRSPWMAEGLEGRMDRARHVLDRLMSETNCRERADEDPAYTLHIAPILLADARSAIRQGIWNQAYEEIQRYLSVRPDDPYGHFLKGEIAYRSDRRMDPAIAEYTRAIELDGAFAPAYRALGWINFKAGRLRKARELFEIGLKLSPDHAENEYIRECLQLCID